MVPKSGTRFSEKIMLNNITTAAFAAGGRLQVIWLRRL
jgi:hypothetical protein